MGELEVNSNSIYILADIFLYGDSASDSLASEFADEIETLWNEPEASLYFENRDYAVRFKISGTYVPGLDEEDVLSNTNPRNNYFRVEDYSPINISWVDGIGSNTGYMFVDNLYKGSTTAAHEFGHTLGLNHPSILNIIGKGTPGIMYPRGTLVDPEFQYDAAKLPGEPGGTIHPKYRRVKLEDIEQLRLQELMTYSIPYVGKFSSVFHPRHYKPEAV